MPPPLEITPVQDAIHGSIRPPGSKSISNRALVVAALAEGTSELTGVLDSRDTEVMIDSLRRLGIVVEHDKASRIVTVAGCAGRPPQAHGSQPVGLWLENSGTSIRFLTALCTLGEGTFRLDGNERMRERPIGDLANALRELGADISLEAGNECPPVVVRANRLPGGTATVAGNISSQYLSALLMSAPAAQSAVEIRVEGELVSVPYVEMTLAVMRAFGVEVKHNVERPSEAVRTASESRATVGTASESRATDDKVRRFVIEPQSYTGRSYDIEPDASAASYFFAAAAITGGSVTVEGLSRNSLQGDVAFVNVLERMGCRVDWGENSITVHGGELRGIDVDMNAISDTAQTLAAVAVFADGPTTIRNIAHVRHKETDRIAAVVTELRRLGITVDEFVDGLTIHPAKPQAATIETYDDHRMAMSFALIGLRSPGIKIADPECTAKTYPRFFEDLAELVAGGS